MATSVFLFRDLVWSGQWKIEVKAGRRSSTISQPCPAQAAALDDTGFNVLSESLYHTIHIPRAFSFVNVTVDALDTTIPLEVGVERKLNTHAYAITTAQRLNAQQWSAGIPLMGIDQSTNTINFVLRFPQASAQVVHINRLHLNFYRAPKTFSSFFNTIWSRQHVFRSSN